MSIRRVCLALSVAAVVPGLTACKSSSSQGTAARAARDLAAPTAAAAAPATQADAGGDDDGPALGDADLALHGPDGKPAKLQPYLGTRLTVVNLWATWCGPCREELPRLSRLHEREAARGLKVVGIALDDDRAVVERFLKKLPVKYPVLFGSKATTDKFGELPGLPATLVLDRAGKVDRVMFGALDDEAEKGLIETLHKN